MDLILRIRIKVIQSFCEIATLASRFRMINTWSVLQLKSGDAWFGVMRACNCSLRIIVSYTFTSRPAHGLSERSLPKSWNALESLPINEFTELAACLRGHLHKPVFGQVGE